MYKKELILASRSPRRKELLESMGLAFTVRVPAVDETPLPGEGPEAHAERLACAKARATESGERTVIAADTIVVLGTRILGKPESGSQACDMLESLSGQTHRVITGVCIRNNRKEYVFSVSTEVAFRTLERTEIEAYVASGEPMDKAGAYAIQGGAAGMVRAVNGSYTNVVGLPLCELSQALISFD
ncbi:MAG: Maf family protein [Kiritimatiellales bacterium]|nr:Maf family protein [Kiritimatiellales bacterium]